MMQKGQRHFASAAVAEMGAPTHDMWKPCSHLEHVTVKR